MIILCVSVSLCLYLLSGKNSTQRHRVTEFSFNDNPLCYFLPKSAGIRSCGYVIRRRWISGYIIRKKFFIVTVCCSMLITVFMHLSYFCYSGYLRIAYPPLLTSGWHIPMNGQKSIYYCPYSKLVYHDCFSSKGTINFRKSFVITYKIL